MTNPNDARIQGSRLSGPVRTVPGLEGGGEPSESVCDSTSIEEAACDEFASFQRPVGLNGIFYWHRKYKVAQRAQAAHLTESSRSLMWAVPSACCVRRWNIPSLPHGCPEHTLLSPLARLCHWLLCPGERIFALPALLVILY